MNSREKAFILILLVVVFLTISCGPVPFERIGFGTISVSADSSGGRSAGGRVVYQSKGFEDQSVYKENRQAGARGNRRWTLTPESFILDVGQLAIYSNAPLEGSTLFDGSTFNKPSSLPDTGGLPNIGKDVPSHYDLAYADDFIRDANVQLAEKAKGLLFRFLPFGDGDSNDGFYIRSVVGIRLPAEYDGIILEGELPEYSAFMPAGLRIFNLNVVQPITSLFLSLVRIGTDIEEIEVINPTGEVGDWNVPFGGHGNGTYLYLPSDQELDFTEYENPELVFCWDLQNLIEIWDHNTPADYSDDIVTLCLDDPFPITIKARENQVKAPTEGDMVAPADVKMPAIAGRNTYNTIQWVNPIDEDFKETVITRKAGSAPTSREDGEEVYRGYVPNYVDSTGESGVMFYYLIQAVDYSGNYSGGFTLYQVQH